jgi:hypothetical protein
MSALNKFEIVTVADIVALSPDQFERFLPDFITYYFLMQTLKGVPLESASMVWCDDSKPGLITDVTLTVKETGESETFKLGGE